MPQSTCNQIFSRNLLMEGKKRLRGDFLKPLGVKNGGILFQNFQILMDLDLTYSNLPQTEFLPY